MAERVRATWCEDATSSRSRTGSKKQLTEHVSLKVVGMEAESVKRIPHLGKEIILISKKMKMHLAP
jgi:hypothetical protein